MQRGLPMRDAPRHNTKPGRHKGTLRDILDMSEYTGIVFETIGWHLKSANFEMMRGSTSYASGAAPPHAARLLSDCSTVNSAVDRVLEYMLDNPRFQPAADEYYHAACYGAFIVPGLAIKLRKLLATACVTDGITPAFGERLKAVVHNMEAVNDEHRFRLTHLCKHWDTHMHNGDAFAGSPSTSSASATFVPAPRTWDLPHSSRCWSSTRIANIASA
eukprot:jgi/Tetstr1/445620/TSEL_003425.t1